MSRDLLKVAFLAVPFAASALLSGCPDPNPTGQFSGTSSAGASSVGGAASPGGAGDGSTAPNSARFDVASGEGVKISGTITYSGPATGRMQLDFLQVPDGGAPQLVNSQQLKGPGKWSSQVPKDFGPLHIVAFIDKDGDGPSLTDPAGRTADPLVISAEDIADVVIVLTDEPDLGNLAPGGTGALPGKMPSPDDPPPDGPPPDGPPPDGPPPDGPPPDGPGAPADAAQGAEPEQ
jgi:hypothetical protein